MSKNFWLWKFGVTQLLPPSIPHILTMSTLPLLNLMGISRLNLTFTRPILSLLQSNCTHYNHTLTHCPLSFNILSSFPNRGVSNSNASTSNFSTLVLPISSTTHIQASKSGLVSSKPKGKMSKRERYESPEHVLRHKLDLCSKHNNLNEALDLYEQARANGTPLSTHHYNVLLYLCSASAESTIEGLERGFEIFNQMVVDKVAPNEATFTSLARLAVARKDPEMAFDLVKKMKDSGIPPKLRSYGPALFGFCEMGEADRAYDVYNHMVECAVIPEEVEITALLRVNVGAKRANRVYEMLHLLRTTVRQVSKDTTEVIEEWFMSETASEAGEDKWDVGKVKEAIVRGGGGWHGLGWLGSGKWNVVKAEMDKAGVCSSCAERLVCIDIDPKETDDFATKLSFLAYQKEKKANFSHFQEWLQRNGPFDSVVDGANISLINSQKFNFRQLNNVVTQLKQLSPSKRLPLVILHKGRVDAGPAVLPNNKRLLDSWQKAGVLYVTPPGSNDDWYWLYAAVSCKCLLVTNDEMRDHLFQLLGNSIFPRWKEKHQVRMTVSRSGLALHMPPKYSIVIQESEEGRWHIPTVTGDDLETPRQWLCATRAARVSSMNRPSRKPLSQVFSAR